jgi:hypothetical protein
VVSLGWLVLAITVGCVRNVFGWSVIRGFQSLKGLVVYINERNVNDYGTRDYDVLNRYTRDRGTLHTLCLGRKRYIC